MATPNIVPRADQEGGLGTAAKGWGKLFIENAATGGTAAATISNLDVDKIAVDINALNTTANVLDITAGALNGGASIYLNSLNGQNDLKLVSSAAAADYFTIATGADGATTLTTVDGTAADAKLTLTADGELEQNCVAWDINASGAATIDAAGGLTVTGAIHIEDLTPTHTTISDTDITVVDKYEYVIRDADGGDITLPAVAAGSRITFVLGIAQTSDLTITAAGGDLLKGYAITTSMSDSSSAAVYFAPDGSDDLIITLNGGTTGGLIGDTIELIGISAEEWRVRARLSTATASGSITTPFS